MKPSSSLPLYVNYDSTTVAERLIFSSLHLSSLPMAFRLKLPDPEVLLQEGGPRLYMGRVNANSAKPEYCISWNSGQTIRINGLAIATERLRMSDVTPCLRNGRNRVADVMIDPVPSHSERGVIFFVYGRPLRVEDACRHIRQFSTMMMRMMNPPPIAYPVAGSDFLVVKLRDARGRLLRIPCRTFYCTHPECFDLERSVEEIGPLLHMGITCPICSAHAPPMHIAIDTFVERVLAGLGDARERISESGDVLIRIRGDATWIRSGEERGKSLAHIWQVRQDETRVSSQVISRSPIIFLQDAASGGGDDIDEVGDEIEKELQKLVFLALPPEFA